MIPLAEGWERVGRTLRKDAISIGLAPVKMVTSMGTAYTKAVDEPDANGYEVSLRVGHPDSSPSESLATFADAQVAWEFAAIATHYVEVRSVDALLAGGDSPGSGKRPSGVVADRSARAVFVELVGHDTDPIEGLYE